MRSGPRKRVVVTRCAEAGARPSSDSIGQAGKLGVEAPTHWTAVRVAPGPGLLQPPTPPSSNPGNRRVAVAELNTATRTAGERRVAARRSPRKVICSRVEPSATDEAQLGIVRALTFHRHVSIMQHRPQSHDQNIGRLVGPTLRSIGTYSLGGVLENARRCRPVRIGQSTDA